MKLPLRIAAFLLVTASCHSEHVCDGPHRSEDAEALANGANDVLAVRQDDGRFRTTPFHVQIGKLANWRTIGKENQRCRRHVM